MMGQAAGRKRAPAVPVAIGRNEQAFLAHSAAGRAGAADGAGATAERLQRVHVKPIRALARLGRPLCHNGALAAFHARAHLRAPAAEGCSSARGANNTQPW